MNIVGRNELICDFFQKGWKYTEIQQTLLSYGCEISLRQLKRILQENNLYRRKNYTDLEIVYDFIANEIKESGQMHGYRFMHQKCKLKKMVVPRKVVYEVMKELDPEGMSLRKRYRLIRRRYYGKGPNYVWHIDSYDKLKPYGICINGCLDGCSRRIIWMEAYYTNSEAKVIGGYFVNCVEEHEGIPQNIRIDDGTENSYVDRLQNVCSEEYWQEERHCVIRGRSTMNRRIRAFWSIYRRQNSEFYISLFHQLASDGLFCGDELDKELMRFTFLNQIQVSTVYMKNGH